MNAELPEVSVVIPTRDRPRLVRRAIRDVVAQSYAGDIEVIVVFDQSEPDTSLELCTPNRRVRVVANDRTPGLAGARNTGALLATGELLGFCDDDDEWLPDKLSAQVRASNATDGPAIVACGIYVQHGDRTVIRLPDEQRLTYDDFLENRIMEVNPCTILAPTRLVLDEIGLVDEELPGSYAEDYEWLLRAVQVADIVVVPQPLTLIHWTSGSFFAARWATIHDAIDYLIAKHPDLAANDVGLARLRGQQAFAKAATGERREALRLAKETRRLNPREKRAWVATLVAWRVVSPGRALRAAHATGRGI